jgi:hypothetical protein
MKGSSRAASSLSATRRPLAAFLSLHRRVENIATSLQKDLKVV